MRIKFTLEYWLDDDWYVGKLKEVPGVFSQGQSLQELEENVRDAYSLMLSEEDSSTKTGVLNKEIEIEM